MQLNKPNTSITKWSTNNQKRNNKHEHEIKTSKQKYNNNATRINENGNIVTGNDLILFT